MTTATTITLPSEIVSRSICAALRQRTTYRSKSDWTTPLPLSVHISRLVARLDECESRGLPPYGAHGRIRERLLAVAGIDAAMSLGALVRLMLDVRVRVPTRALDQVGIETAAWVAAELCEWWQGTVLLASPTAGIHRPAKCAIPKVREEHRDEILASADVLGVAWPDLPRIVRGQDVAMLPEEADDDGCWGDELSAPSCRPWRPT